MMDEHVVIGGFIAGIIAVVLAIGITGSVVTRKYKFEAVERGYAEWVKSPNNPSMNIWQWVEPEIGE